MQLMCVFAACWPVFCGSALRPRLRAEVSRQSCGMAGMAGMPGTRGPVPDAHPRSLQRRVYACVRPVQSRAVRRSKRSRLSSSDTFTRRQGPTCACLFHEDSDFTRRLICARTLSACHNLFTLHLSSPGHLTLVSPHVISPHQHHQHHLLLLLFSASLDSITVLSEPAGNPPAQPVLGAPSRSTPITIIQQLSLH